MSYTFSGLGAPTHTSGRLDAAPPLLSRSRWSDNSGVLIGHKLDPCVCRATLGGDGTVRTSLIVPDQQIGLLARREIVTKVSFWQACMTSPGEN